MNVYQDNKVVDLIIWKSFSHSLLSFALDGHSGNKARKPGLLIQNKMKVKVG